MFQFPAFALTKVSTWPSAMWVPPFGHLRINSCLQIPGAFRSLPRPSSRPEAKASSVRSYSLFLVLFVNHTLTTLFQRLVFLLVLPYEIVALQLEKTSNLIRL